MECIVHMEGSSSLSRSGLTWIESAVNFFFLKHMNWSQQLTVPYLWPP
jgi:hypothetical protein